MDISKVQFVRREDLQRRMSQFTPPEGEHYIFRPLENGFFECGISFSYEVNGKTTDCNYRLFRIYAGDKDLYFHIRGMMEDVAKELDRTLESEEIEWKKDEDKASETTDK